MKILRGIAILAIMLGVQVSLGYARSYPLSPDPELTPGSLCEQPDYYRYPERIAYCERDVDSQTKREIIRTYDQKRGYRVGFMNRSDFKIDHFIPLCAGGSNSEDNLWPQHRSVYDRTDPVEQEVCKALSRGQIRQAKAIELIRRMKTDLDEVEAVASFISRF